MFVFDTNQREIRADPFNNSAANLKNNKHNKTMDLTIAVFISTLLIIISIYLQFRRSYTYWANRNIAFVEPTFPFGCIKEVCLSRTTLGDLIADHYDYYTRQGARYFGLYYINKPALVLLDPNLIKNVLIKDFKYFTDRGFYYNEKDDPLSAHLFSLSGHKWRKLRLKLNPTFTSGKLKYMFSTLVDCTKDLKTCLNGFIRKSQPIDIKEIASLYTTDVVGSCAFGIQCHSLQKQDSEFVRSTTKFFVPGKFQRIKHIFSNNFPDIAGFFRFRVFLKDMENFFKRVVKENIDYRDKNQIERNDFFQLLMQMRDEATKGNEESTLKEFATQTFMFFAAGHETSSSTMTFCLYLLAKNEDVQEKIREEILHILQMNNGNYTYEGMMKMELLQLAILESMRLYPSVTSLRRIVTEPYTLPNSDLTLEKNTIIVIPSLAMQNDERYFPNPDKFDIYRFTEENKKTRPDMTYLPFGDGPRICIGFRFALMQVKVGLCALLSNYKFSVNSRTQEPIKSDPSFNVNSVLGKVWLDAEKIAT